MEVLTLDAPNEPWIAKFSLPVPVHALGPSRFNYAYCPYLLDWLKQHHHLYDAVIVHGIWQYHSFAVWQALRHTKTPYFVFTHGMLDPWFKRQYPLKHLKKWLYWPWAEYRVLRDARAVLFTCEEERLLARQSFWLYRCREAVVNYGTARPPLEEARQREAFYQAFPALRGKPLLLFLSRIHPKKGCDLLIEAFSQAAKNCEHVLVMAGPDQVGWQAELQQQAQALGIADRIIWPGMLIGDLKWGAFAAAEAFVLPSHQENFGIAVAEALACGKPVLIAKPINIWREIVEDQAGLVEDDTLDGTLRLLQRWLALSPDEQLQMAVHARQCFEERFTIERTAESFLGVVRELGDQS